MRTNLHHQIFDIFLPFPIKSTQRCIVKIFCGPKYQKFIPKTSQNQYINICKKNIYKKFRKINQNPNRDLLDPTFETNKRPINTDQCEVVPASKLITKKPF